MSATQRLQNIDAPLRAVKQGIKEGDLLLLQLLRSWASPKSLPVYLVGGPVRDALLGSPIKDLDFVVEGDAPKLAYRVAQATGGEVLAHPRFQTATVSLDGSRVDIVTARKETYPQPGSLPQVTPGAIDDDLARRDFSVNALALPLWEQVPKVLDRHGGLKDLELRVLRVLHARSFDDDPTRILRAIRYEQRLGFSLDKDTSAQLAAALGQGRLGAVTADRVRHELERIFAEARPELALKRAIQLGVLAAIHPGLASVGALERLVARAPSGLLAEQPLCYLASLVYPLSRDQVEGLIGRLNLPNSWAAVVRDTIALKEMEPALADPALSASQVSTMLEGLSSVSVCAASLVSKSSQGARRLCQYWDEWRHRVPVLTGRDLVAMGVPEGPMVGSILRELRLRRIDGTLADEEGERQVVEEILSQKRPQIADG